MLRHGISSCVIYFGRSLHSKLSCLTENFCDLLFHVCMSGVRMRNIFLALDTSTSVTQKLSFYYFYYDIKISIALDATGAGCATLVTNTGG